MLSRCETWDTSVLDPTDVMVKLPFAQRIRLLCQLQSVTFVPGHEKAWPCSSWEVHMKARMLDLEREYPIFSLWDTVDRSRNRGPLRGWIDRAIGRRTVCIVESDIFSLGKDGLLLRFATIKALESRQSGPVPQPEA